ncbi:MAG: hypothetical protein AAF950_10790 [Pseudomonadota bacterium]
MPNKEFCECLQEIYQAEQMGEAAFGAMLRQAETDEQKYILGSLLQLETEGKAIMRPVLSRYSLDMHDDQQSQEAGQAASTAMTQMTWVEGFGIMRDQIVSMYLPKYLELATLVSEKEDPEAAKVAKFMGEHERVVLAAAENIVAGRDDPIAPVREFLHFPLARA